MEGQCSPGNKITTDQKFQSGELSHEATSLIRNFSLSNVTERIMEMLNEAYVGKFYDQILIPI